MHLLEIIYTRLVAQSVVDATWKGFIGYTPDDQDKAISLELTGGMPQDTLCSTHVNETFQVRVRAGKLDYTVCEAKWRGMYNALHDADLSAYNIALIQALTGGPLAWNDEKNRVCMSANFKVIRRTP